MLCTAVFVAGCGSSGGDNEPGIETTEAVEFAPDEFLVNPAVSWRARSSGNPTYIGAIATVSLERFDVNVERLAGRVLAASSIGSFTEEPSTGKTNTVASLLFVDAASQPLAPAAGSTASPAERLPECGATTGPDPFPGDVLISGSGAELVVPAGAKFIWLATDDCFHADNVQDQDPLRVRLTLKP